MTGKVIFVSGIDTDIGKTVATGFYANLLAQKGFSVITQKMIQTGCQGMAEDIITHRKIQGIELTLEDQQGLTCPYLFDYPCSPHLAAKMQGVEIKGEKIDQATRTLQQRYDYVLLEGAGGLAVPYHHQQTTLDFIRERQYPVILVTSGKLGSINHTLLSLMACQKNNLHLEALIYNLHPEKDLLITKDTQQFLQSYLAKNYPQAAFISLPKIEF